MMKTPWYKDAYRRILVDMHIPDWDEAFLSRYDVDQMVQCYERAGVNSVMFYCQSHLGLCYWPTRSGTMHRGLKGRDIVGEMLGRLKERKIAACAYYSVIHNNQAGLEHPEWRMIPAGGPPESAYHHSRYGSCCPLNPGYRDFARVQTEELVRGYDFDGVFFDMTMWAQVCLCPACRQRFHGETQHEIPEHVDWGDPVWCAFQAARERWVTEFGAELTALVQQIRPGLPVYHNFASAYYHWTWGLPLAASAMNDFLGGDFYGSPMEQLAVIKLMLNLSENRPVEFMTTFCRNLNNPMLLKPAEELEIQAFAATLFSAAFLFIDAVDPLGTVNPALYDLIGGIFAKTAAYEAFLGGAPVEELAIYFSNESKMDLAEHGIRIGERPYQLSFPHQQSIQHLCRILQRAHLPFGVITRKQLGELGRYRVVILADAPRMDSEEVQAIRDYVQAGGRLYASGPTSLYESKGEKQSDFMLADLFGCHYAGDDLGRVAYLKPRGEAQRAAITPLAYLASPAQGTLRLAPEVEGEVLATLTRPYGSPHEGSLMDRHWASIHSSPPWEDTELPVVVHQRCGQGEVIYCATCLERLDDPAGDRFILHCLDRLIHAPLAYQVEAHPAVWANVNYHDGTGDFLVGFLNYQTQYPLLPAGAVQFVLQPPPGRRFVALLHLPDLGAVDYAIDEHGALHGRVEALRVFEMLLARTEGA